MQNLNILDSNCSLTGLFVHCLVANPKDGYKHNVNKTVDKSIITLLTQGIPHHRQSVIDYDLICECFQDISWIQDFWTGFP